MRVCPISAAHERRSSARSACESRHTSMKHSMNPRGRLLFFAAHPRDLCAQVNTALSPSAHRRTTFPPPPLECVRRLSIVRSFVRAIQGWRVVAVAFGAYRRQRPRRLRATWDGRTSPKSRTGFGCLASTATRRRPKSTASCRYTVAQKFVRNRFENYVF